MTVRSGAAFFKARVPKRHVRESSCDEHPNIMGCRVRHSVSVFVWSCFHTHPLGFIRLEMARKYRYVFYIFWRVLQRGLFIYIINTLICTNVISKNMMYIYFFWTMKRHKEIAHISSRHFLDPHTSFKLKFQAGLIKCSDFCSGNEWTWSHT